MTFAVSAPFPGVLADRLPVRSRRLPATLARDAMLVLSGAGLTGLAAQVSIHTSLSPVPFTLQTLAVLVVGASLGSVRGALSLALYAVAGLAGVPIFEHGTSGWNSASFGYVLGFVAAAGLVGALARRGSDRRVWTTVLTMLAGEVVLYAFGATWLAVDLHLGVADALRLGVRPFLVTDALKLAVAALAFPAAWRLVRR